MTMYYEIVHNITVVYVALLWVAIFVAVGWGIYGFLKSATDRYYD